MNFSIMVPTRNRVILLVNLIESIVNNTQELDKTEIIIMHDNDDNSINDTNFFNFIKLLSNHEPELMKNESKRSFTYSSAVIDNATTVTRTISTREEKFTYTSGGPETNIIKTFDFEKFRYFWYENELLPKKNLEIITSLLRPDHSFLSVENITNMCHDYIKGIFWVYSYYSKGMNNINNHWYYHYYHAPLFVDLSPCLEIIQQEKNKIIGWEFNSLLRVLNPIHQLLSVLPASSSDLLPEEIIFLTDINSPLEEYYPIDFNIERYGTNNEWEGISILPFVDPIKIITVMDQYVDMLGNKISLYNPGANIIIDRDKTATELLRAKKKTEYLLQSSQRQPSFKSSLPPFERRDFFSSSSQPSRFQQPSQPSRFQQPSQPSSFQQPSQPQSLQPPSSSGFGLPLYKKPINKSLLSEKKYDSDKQNLILEWSKMEPLM